MGFILRDLLKLASTLGEGKKILQSAKVSVDGKTRKDYQFPVGLFDVVSIKADENKTQNYRALLDNKGRIYLKEISIKHPSKVVKIVAKKAAKKGLMQLTTNDGRTLMEKQSKHKIGDSLQIELPEQKIMKSLEFKQGNIAFIVGGKNVGAMAKIKEIIPSTMNREKTITLESKGKQFKTTHNHALALRKKKQLKQI